MTRYDDNDDDDGEIDDEEMTKMTMTTRLGRWMTWILDDNGGDDDVFVLSTFGHHALHS